MLSDKDANATIAVKDINVARRFYEGTLGLKVEQTMGDGGTLYTSGRSRVLVYVSRYAGTNRATAATWNVGSEIDKIVHDLAAEGVVFEHYDDLPDTTRKGDIHYAGKLRLAWLKDPDGNILALAGE